MTYKRKEIIGDCTLYLGDTREVLPELGECADLVVSDVPYELTSGGGNPKEGVKKMSGCFNHEEYCNDGSLIECNIEWHEFMPLIYKCLYDDSHAYVMCNNRHVQNMLNEAENTKFHFHNLLVWDKGTVTPNRWYMKNLEFTGFFKKGAAKFINNCSSKQLLYVPQEDYGKHPTTKPVALMEHYIRNSSKAGETVADPFMGVGSTGVACIKSNRKFIGIEIDEKWFDLACKRISDFYEQPKQVGMEI